MINMRFYKDADNKWYADYKEWTGAKWELEMVCGADTMLDIISQGEDECYVTLSLEPFDGSDILSKIKETPDIGGALYHLNKLHGFEYNLEVWLCHVVAHVFGKIPEIIYIA